MMKCKSMKIKQFHNHQYRENTLLCLHKTPILFHFDDCQCFNSFGFLKVKRGESAKTPKRPPKHVGKKKAPHSFLSLGV